MCYVMHFRNQPLNKHESKVMLIGQALHKVYRCRSYLNHQNRSFLEFAPKRGQEQLQACQKLAHGLWRSVREASHGQVLPLMVTFVLQCHAVTELLSHEAMCIASIACDRIKQNIQNQD